MTTCLVAMYHYVRDTAVGSFPDIRALSPAAFEQQLDWIQETRTIVDAATFEAALTGHTSLPPRAALLTFDDGFADHHDVVLPILAARKLSGIFFVSGAPLRPTPRVLEVHKTHFLLAFLGAEAFGQAVLNECATLPRAGRPGAPFGVDRWEDTTERAIKNLLNYELPFDEASRILAALFERHIGNEVAFARELYVDERQIATMAAAGMTFGYHTRSHRMLSRLTADEQRRELAEGCDLIRTMTGQERVSFCYPWGGAGTYTADTVCLLQTIGYSMAFNTLRREARLDHDGRYELPRIDTRDLPPHDDGVAVQSATGAA